jgi:PAS domain S-box-containing protein
VHFETFPIAGGVGCLVRDITDEVQKERLADVKGAILDSMIVHGGVGYARLSARGTIDRADEPLLQMIKLSQERLIGVPVVDLVPAAQRVAFRDKLEAVLRGEGSARIETEFLTNDGKLIAVDGALVELRGVYGTEGAVLVVTEHTRH